MGRQLERVPLEFKHPVDRNGKFIPGAHYEALYELTDEQKPGYQIYENVSEGTPVSPVFASEEMLKNWLVSQGNPVESADRFIEWGHAPMLVIDSGGKVHDGIIGLSSTIESIEKRTDECESYSDH